MSFVVAALWFCTPVLLALAYLWASKRLPMPLWAGVLGPLNILAIIVIAVPAVEVLTDGRRGHDLQAALVAGALLQVPALACWLGWRWFRSLRQRGYTSAAPRAPAEPQGEIAHLHRIRALRERARRETARGTGG